MVNMDIVLDVRNAKRLLSPQVFSMFLDRLRRVKKVFLFEEIPSEEDFLSMSDLEKDILNDMWALMPSAALRASSIPYEVVSNPMAFLPAYSMLSRLFEHHGYPQFSSQGRCYEICKRDVLVSRVVVVRRLCVFLRFTSFYCNALGQV
jgi:hypothetical protein